MDLSEQPANLASKRLIVEWTIAILGGALIWWLSLSLGQSLFELLSSRSTTKNPSLLFLVIYWAIWCVGGSAPVLVLLAFFCFAIRRRKMFWIGLAGCLICVTFFVNHRYGSNAPFETVFPMSFMGTLLGGIAGYTAPSD